MRSRISPAALLVNVTARIRLGSTPVLVDQARDARGEDARLAGAGAGEDEQGAFDVQHGLALRGVESRRAARSSVAMSIRAR